MARASKISMKGRSRKSCGTKRLESVEDLIDQIKFLASANRLKTKAKFLQKEKNEILDTLQRSGGSYEFLYDLSESMNMEKNYDVVMSMLRKKSKYNACDQGLIVEMANAFIRDVGVK